MKCLKAVLPIVLAVAGINQCHAQPNILVALESPKYELDKDFIDSVEWYLNSTTSFTKPFTYVTYADWISNGLKLKGIEGDDPDNPNEGFTNQELKELAIIFGKGSENKGDYILIVSLKEKVKHYNTPDVRFLRVAVVDLNQSSYIEVLNAYINKKQECWKVVPLIIGHLKDLVTSSVQKETLYILDGGYKDSNLAKCSSYRSSIKAFFLDPEFFKYYYVLYTAKDGQAKSIEGESTSGQFHLQYKEAGDIVHREPSQDDISCSTPVSVYVKGIKSYCKKICDRCNSR